jgi:hypothetical protein
MTDNTLHDDPDAIALWQSLRHYLSVELDVEEPGNLQPSTTVGVTYTVTNTASSGLDMSRDTPSMVTGQHISRATR